MTRLPTLVQAPQIKPPAVGVAGSGVRALACPGKRCGRLWITTEGDIWDASKAAEAEGRRTLQVALREVPCGLRPAVLFQMTTSGNS